ncbi:MAG: hypothetical protein NZX77_15030, partial [Polyangiaceae bacterium]|nr:hypothetical protein [Polyangiaceae bacterium]
TETGAPTGVQTASSSATGATPPTRIGATPPTAPTVALHCPRSLATKPNIPPSRPILPCLGIFPSRLDLHPPYNTHTDRGCKGGS